MKNKLFYIFCIIVLMASACTENIDIDINTEEERLIIESRLTDQVGETYVLLSHINLNPVDSIVSGITGARVTISNGTDTMQLTESGGRVGLYAVPNGYVGTPGITYTLQVTGVEINGTGTDVVYSATATMLQPMVLDSVTAKYYDKGDYWELQCWALDSPTKNYYLFKAWRNGVCLSDSIFEYQFTDDALFNGNYTYGIGCQYLQDEYKDEYVVDGDSLELEIDIIDKDYYRFLNEMITEYSGSNPMFGGPPSNVYTNFDNNAVGYFAVYSVAKAGCVVKDAAREGK